MPMAAAPHRVVLCRPLRCARSLARDNIISPEGTRYANGGSPASRGFVPTASLRSLLGEGQHNFPGGDPICQWRQPRIAWLCADRFAALAPWRGTTRFPRRGTPDANGGSPASRGFVPTA